MKKWMYVIFPSAMLGVFLFFYFAEAKDAELREKKRVEMVAKQKTEDDERKRVIEEKARQDAEKRAAERAAEEKKKEDDKIAKWQAETKRIQDEIDKDTATGNRLAKEAADLEIQLDTLRKSKDKANRDAFDLLKQVELAKVARRNAELEVQRTTEMISRKAAQSSLVKPPMIVTPAPAK